MDTFKVTGAWAPFRSTHVDAAVRFGHCSATTMLNQVAAPLATYRMRCSVVCAFEAVMKPIEPTISVNCHEPMDSDGH